jgi:methyl-accepting chemotaxis protein
MSLTRKLLSSFGAMLALVLLLSASTVLITTDLSGDLDRTANVTARSQYLAGEVDTYASDMASLERGTVFAAVLGDVPRVAEYQRSFGRRAASLKSVLTDLHRTADAGEAMALMGTLDQQSGLVQAAHDELRRALADQKIDAALDIFARKVQPSLEQIGRQASSLVDQQNRELSAVAQAASAKSNRIMVFTTGLALLALAVGGSVLWLVLHTNRGLKLLSARLAESAEQVAGAASQVSDASCSLADGASQQAASLEETSASTEEIASITRKNADHALQVAGLVQQSAEASTEVNETLDRMVEKMKEIDGSSHKIARIIKVIDEIAFQTNILALNAAVEAARAGESGLGFAVVADEVRNLAQRSAQAARDTANLIEESIETSRDGNSRLDQMAGAVRALTERSVHVKTLVDEVTHGSQEQARGMEQISGTILQMEKVTQKTASSAQDGASAGTELTGYARSLRGLVEEMREMVGSS